MVEEKLKKAIKKGDLKPFICEELKTNPLNLKFCPDKEKCQWLESYLIDPYQNKHELITNMFCPFCKSERWLFVGLTSKNNMFEMTCSPEVGKEFKEVINKLKTGIPVTTGQFVWNCVCLGCIKLGYTDEKHLPHKCDACGGEWISHKQAVKKYGLGEIPGYQNEDGVKIRITEDTFHLVSD